MKIKVCGLKDPENIKDVAALRPDLMGFIFYKGSPRYVDGLDPEVLKRIDERICKTGVFVNDTLENIKTIITTYHLNSVQLHGDESPGFCESLRKETQVIKAFGVNENFNFDEVEAYISCVDYFLFDTKTSGHGGSGKTFDWNVLNNYRYDLPFFLSGGLSPENIVEALKLDNPQFYGVDLNSRFEIGPGIKDINKLKQVFDLITDTE